MPKVCINCGSVVTNDSGEAVTKLYDRKLYNKSRIIKLLACLHCGRVCDKYLEYDGTLLLLDAALQSKPALRHLLINSDHSATIRKVSLLTLIVDGYCRQKLSPFSLLHGLLLAYCTRFLQLVALLWLTPSTTFLWTAVDIFFLISSVSVSRVMTGQTAGHCWAVMLVTHLARAASDNLGLVISQSVIYEVLTTMAEQEEAQFQADLARALELSLQTAAQETTRRDSQLAGKTDRCSSDEVVTTEVRPRSRPEGRKLDGTLSLPPPPILEKKKFSSVDNSRGAQMDNEDLISFASPNPSQKKEGQFRADLESISFDNNNENVVEKFKAVQSLFSRTAETAAPAPPARTTLPVQNKNGGLTYQVSSLPNANRYNVFPSQSYQQNLRRQPPPPYNFNLPNQPPPPGQSAFTPNTRSEASNSLSPLGNMKSLTHQTNIFKQASNSGGVASMVKSSSWNDDILTSTPKRPSSSSLRHTSPPPSLVSSSHSSKSRQRLSYSQVKVRDPDSLIDLGQSEDGNTTTVSILHDFDPLNEANNEEEEEEIYWSSKMSNFSESFYDNNDPFSYMEQQAELTGRISEVDDDSVDSPEPPVIPRRMVGVVRPTSIASEATIQRRSLMVANYENVVKKDRRIFECIGVERKPAVALDGEVLSFIEMVKAVRSRFRHSELDTNPGIVTAVKLSASYPPNTEVKLVVDDVVFTATVDSELAVIVAAVLAKQDREERAEDFTLKIKGQAEYLVGGELSEYEYVHQCYKYDQDLQLSLVHNSQIRRELARTSVDDETDQTVGFSQISPLDTTKTLSYDDLRILVSTLQKEADRIGVTARTLASCSEKEVMKALRPKQMLQAVKAVASLVGGVETLELREACDLLCKTCMQFDQAKGNETPDGRLRPEIVEELGEKYAMVTLSRKSDGNYHHFSQEINESLMNIKNKVEDLIRTYSRTFRVDFELDPPEVLTPVEPRLTTDIRETLLVKISCIHRLDVDWDYLDYRVDCRVYHGTKMIMETLSTPLSSSKNDHQDLHRMVIMDHFVEFQSLEISKIPLEARLVVSVVGRARLEEKAEEIYKYSELGWASLQMFSHDLKLAQGAFILPVWPVEANMQVGPAPDAGSHPFGSKCALVSILLPDLGGPVTFPHEVSSLPPQDESSWDQLDRNTKQQLADYCEQDILAFNTRHPQDKEILWDKRYYLRGVAGALPKVLLAARTWDPASLPGLYGLLESWPRPDVIDILQLLLPIFPDMRVRATAVAWLSSLQPDSLLDFLPQLVEAVKHETWAASPLASLLIESSLTSPRVGHNLYWLLTQALPGVSPQNSLETAADADGKSQVSVSRYHRRLQLLLRAIFAVSGQSVRNRFLAQQVLIQNLNSAATSVQSSKENAKPVVLARYMEQLHHQLRETPTLVPLSASLMVNGVDVKTCSYFNSNTFPLKLVFTSRDSDGGAIKAIYKVGDDLRQDMLTLQMIRVMDRLWLKDGIDLRMVSFNCVPTGWKAGIVEFVENANTLRQIQVTANSVTGAFKPEVLNDWLQKHNPGPHEFENAVKNFSRSCAGYSVVTYIMGIGDRHNDNIMVRTSGHLFHIDFGKFLGDAQMFGNIKRDRVPFVLTPDMVYVINGGDKMTSKFHTFVDLCCQAFNSLRHSGNLLLTLFTLMASSGIPGVTKEAVSYVQERLLLDLSNAEAAARFSQLIHESMSSMSTQLNFFVHNLAQLKFGTEQASEDEMLSFIPKRYSMAAEGRIQAVEVHGIQKRYDQEKYYVFILKVTRLREKVPTYIFRTYKEFYEFHSRLCTLYPLSKFHSLPKGLSIGRSEIREVAEKRKREIGGFLQGLFRLSDEISHSDLVYTFFHPLHRDQKEANIHINKLKEPRGHQRKPSAGTICGKIKLSISYRVDTLYVLVQHIENLTCADSASEEPNSYVKVYLHPDPTKQTKRKTKVVKRNCNPSFMEMLEYRIPRDVVTCRTLQATVWDNSQFQENMFLGSATLRLDQVDLASGEEKWYKLGQFSRH